VQHIVESTVNRVREDRELQHALDRLSPQQRECLGVTVRKLCQRAHAQVAGGPVSSPGSQQLLNALRGDVNHFTAPAAIALAAEAAPAAHPPRGGGLDGDALLQDIMGAGCGPMLATTPVLHCIGICRLAFN
jgi:hypothetical protein